MPPRHTTLQFTQTAKYNTAVCGATSLYRPTIPSPANGGAVQNEQGTVRFTDCRFNDNTAGLEGGGIYSFKDSIVTIEGCQFLLNEAGQRGGGVYSQKSNVTVVDCLFQQNEADQGGGMYHSGGAATTLANLRLRDSTFKNNSALGVALDGNGGGLALGLQPDGRLVEIVNCQFIDNDADDNGAPAFSFVS